MVTRYICPLNLYFNKQVTETTAVRVKWVAFVLGALLTFEGIGQYSEQELIHKVQSLQVHQDEFYDDGLFRSQRNWSFFHGTLEDNTIFFTASIVSTLKMNEGLMIPESKKVSELIASKANPTWQKYKSRNGEPTFNFWQTANPDLPFPNANSLISNRRGRLPDDFNTTILVLLSRAQSDSLDRALRQRMISYSAREDRSEVKLLTPKKYASSKAYEVWFGKNMPQTFDICVMSNIMYYVINRDFVVSEYDKATLALINEMILSKDFIYRTKDIAHHTSSSAVVLYHVARLLSVDIQGFLDPIRQLVIDELNKLSKSIENEVEKAMALSSLYRLGQRPTIEINFAKFEEDVDEFKFFEVNPSNISTGKGRLLPSIYWKCEAYSWVLGMEYVLLKKSSVSREAKE